MVLSHYDSAEPIYSPLSFWDAFSQTENLVVARWASCSIQEKNNSYDTVWRLLIVNIGEIS